VEGTGTGIGLARTGPDGRLELVDTVAPIASPSWLVERAGHVYATAEGSGEVHSFRRDGMSLVHDGIVSSGGTLPCHLTLLDSALVVSNYADGPVGVIALTPDGSVGELVQSLAGEGSGPRPSQPGPHAHASLLVDAATVLTLDLGADRIHVHHLDNGRLERTASVVVAAGTGPRDVAVHASGLIFVLGELSGDVLVYEWADGGLELVASVPVPGRVEGDHGAGLAFSADGRFIYTGLRGSHRVSVLSVSDDGRELTPVGWVSSEGEWPRHLVVDGDVLHVANQVSNSIASFRLGADGLPTLIGAPTAAPSPAYLLPVQ
jgi:6-phosphogluconolactonase (cycloisomerase 2 family)